MQEDLCLTIGARQYDEFSKGCYAWEVDGEVTAVLHTGPVESPQDAVRASIMAK